MCMKMLGPYFAPGPFQVSYPFAMEGGTVFSQTYPLLMSYLTYSALKGFQNQEDP